MTQFLERAWQGDLSYIRNSIDAAHALSADENGYTLLHIAAAIGNLEMAKLAIDFGVEVDKTENGGKSALMLACDSDSLAVAEFLLTQGSNVNRKDPIGDMTALLMSAYSSGPELFNLLINHGADISAIDSSKHDVMDYCLKEIALNFGFHESENETGDFEPIFFKFAKDRNYRSDSELASFSDNDMRKVQLLLDGGFPINRRNSNENTPLLSAVILNRTRIAELLIDQGATQTAQDKAGRSIEDWARRWNNRTILARLGGNI